MNTVTTEVVVAAATEQQQHVKRREPFRMPFVNSCHFPCSKRGVGRRWNSSRIWWSLLRLCPLARESYRHIFKIAAPAACTRTAPTETSVALGYRVPSARLFALGLPFCRVVPEALEAVAQRGALRWVHSRTNAHTLGYLSLSSVCLVVSSVRHPKRPSPWTMFGYFGFYPDRRYGSAGRRSTQLRNLVLCFQKHS